VRRRGARWCRGNGRFPYTRRVCRAQVRRLLRVCPEPVLDRALAAHGATCGIAREVPGRVGGDRGRASIRLRRSVRWVSISVRRCCRAKSGSRLTLSARGMLVLMYPPLLPAASRSIVLVVLDDGSADIGERLDPEGVAERGDDGEIAAAGVAKGGDTVPDHAAGDGGGGHDGCPAVPAAPMQRPFRLVAVTVGAGLPRAVATAGGVAHQPGLAEDGDRDHRQGEGPAEPVQKRLSQRQVEVVGDEGKKSRRLYPRGRGRKPPEQRADAAGVVLAGPLVSLDRLVVLPDAFHGCGDGVAGGGLRDGEWPGVLGDSVGPR
jgi:hypothetical protein